MHRRLARRGLMIGVALTGVLALSAGDAAAQLDGRWEIFMEGPRGTRAVTVVLESNGGTLTGVAQMAPPPGGRGPRGDGGGGGPREIEVSDGSFDGTTFVFSITRSMRGNTVTEEFVGSVEGGEMTGTVTTPRGEQPFTGRRIE